MATAPAELRRPTRVKTFPVVEIFGPTIQGEGSEAGVPTHFIRLGGCDYRCSWCDTMYAVDPTTVRANSRKLSAEQIVEEINARPPGPAWVTISGGNPALHEFGRCVDLLQAAGLKVSVETQGSVWREWLRTVDRLTISPKPPSSEMATPGNEAQFTRFMERLDSATQARATLKVVCFNEVDLAWAKSTAAAWPDLPFYLSAGTPVPAEANVRDAVGERYAWLCERVATDPALREVRVLPQLHVIAWKGAKGV